MSGGTPEEQAPALPEGAIRCARCGAEVPADRDWCLECGLAARTRIAPTPAWRVPLIAAAVVAALALAALAVAVVDLPEDPAPAPAQTAPATLPPPATTATPTAPATTPTAPATTTATVPDPAG